jgi:diguanylate cyclase (GGDEF)-like protein
LARRFTYRYAIAVAGFMAVAIVTIVSYNATLDRVDAANEQLRAVSVQVDRVQEIAALADRLSSAELNPAEVTGDDGEVAKLRNDYFNELAEFRNIHLGLTEGTGNSGLPDPPPDIDEWWFESGQDRVEEISDFHKEADALSGQLGGVSPDTAEIARLNGYIQTTANPIDGSVAMVYAEAVPEYTDYLDDQIERQREINQGLVALYVTMAAVVVFVIFRPLGQRIQLETTALLEAERGARENNERQLFRNQLVLGLERASSEEEIFGRVEAALREALPGRPAELLLADSTSAHLRQVQDHPEAGAPNCPVDDPSDCVAIARGVTVRFETSRALDVCPKLPQHEASPCSAVCSPVRFLGQPLGVLHVVGPDLTPPEHQVLERINVIADETGDRLGTLRATRETRLQATTDGLTGLPNRRSLEAAAEELISAGRQFAVAMADLDHFKDLNDTYGHEAGDRALRLFARTLRSNLRPDDTASRYGGEEFVLLLPDTALAEARTALDRLRVTLAGDIAASGNVPFTASWGLTTSDTADGFTEMIQAADEALYAAKRAGRNRVCVAGNGGTASAVHPPAPAETIVLGNDGSAEKHTDSTTCGSCWFENPVTSSYCLRCGSALEAESASPADSSTDGHDDLDS